MVPAEAWTALDQSQDPVAAFRRFAAWVGCDAETLRRRDTRQLARMQTAIDLIISLHPIRSFLSDIGADRIRRALLSSTDSELAEQAHEIEALAAAEACRLRAEHLRPCASFQRFSEIVDELCRDPLSNASDEIEIASVISDRLVRAMRRCSDTELKFHTIAPEVARILAGTSASNPDRDVYDGILIRSEDIGNSIKDDAFLTVEQIEELADEFSTLLSDILGIYNSHSSSGPPGDDDDYVDERDEALRFFGFVSGSSPPQSEIKKVFRDLWKKHNVDDPSNRATEAQRLENERVLKEINRHMSALRGKKLDVTA
jgi:hypothetical protein